MNLPDESHLIAHKKVVFLIPIFPVIFFFLHNISSFMELVLTKEVLILFIIYSLFAIIIFLSVKFILRQSIQFAAIISSLVMLVFLFFGVLQDYLIQFKKNNILTNTYFLLFAGIIFIIITSIFINRNPRRLKNTIRYFLLLYSLLTLFESSMICYKLMTGKSISAITSRMVSPINIKADSTIDKPDIYYIVFDGYTGPATLREFWGFENDIYPYLNSKGFFTIDSGFSNYKSTPFSISSILSLQYLTGSQPYLYSNSSNFLVGQKVYAKNILYDFLKQQHYDFSIYSQLEDKKMLTAFGFLGVDEPVNWLRKLTLERIYLDPWKLNKLRIFFGGKSDQKAVKLESMLKFDDYNKRAIAHIFTDCENSSTSKLNKPIFSFTHFMLPHDPYLRDELGNPVVSPEPGGMDMNGYLKQVKYSNQLIKQITECLLGDTTRKKIIIFQGDHGYRHYTNAPVNRQFEALNAIYFYNHKYNNLRKNMSHVNTFRIVVNNIFGSNLPLLEDRFYLLKKE